METEAEVIWQGQQWLVRSDGLVEECERPDRCRYWTRPDGRKPEEVVAHMGEKSWVNVGEFAEAYRRACAVLSGGAA